MHSDVRGPMQENSLGGTKYFETFIDDDSNCLCVVSIKVKPDAALRSLSSKQYAEKHTGWKVKVVRSDRGCQYFGKILQSHFEQNEIKRQLTSVYSSYHNSVAERMNRMLQDLSRSASHITRRSKC